ncbi:LysR family transcriptional regulator [Roseibium marinum]|uniref:DNA-binding transcriptional LysR family regulator n=1 Tax=Roseibium marinum TaxID=281252 RepID=A0A2S3V4J0_9HYPH|nr:LysR family transcriptional regulator [Roseibium marinum]POF34904.1 DNA-binding transcriptional LysR family regulator [Roseibium marinum]
MSYSPQHFDRLRLRHLRLLALIDRHGSLREVGKVLNLTQPAVSQMVKDLELALGVTLIDRSVRGVTLCPAGRLALERARAGLATFDHLVSELHEDQVLTLRIGTNSALVPNILPAALRRLGSTKETIRYRLRTGIVSDMMHELAEGTLDCYVGRVDWEWVPHNVVEALRYDPLTRTELVLACPLTHPLAGNSAMEAGDLAGQRWALPPHDSSNRLALETGLRNLGLGAPVAEVEVAADPSALIHLARELDLLTCVPMVALETHLASREFQVLNVPDLALPPIQIGFVTLKEQAEIPPLQAFRQALIDVTVSGWR